MSLSAYINNLLTWKSSVRKFPSSFTFAFFINSPRHPVPFKAWHHSRQSCQSFMRIYFPESVNPYNPLNEIRQEIFNNDPYIMYYRSKEFEDKITADFRKQLDTLPSEEKLDLLIASYDMRPGDILQRYESLDLNKVINYVIGKKVHFEIQKRVKEIDELIKTGSLDVFDRADVKEIESEQRWTE